MIIILLDGIFENALISGGTFCAGYDLSQVAAGEILDGDVAAKFLKEYRFMASCLSVSMKRVMLNDGVSGSFDDALLKACNRGDRRVRGGRRLGIGLHVRYASSG